MGGTIVDKTRAIQSQLDDESGMIICCLLAILCNPMGSTYAFKISVPRSSKYSSTNISKKMEIFVSTE